MMSKQVQEGGDQSTNIQAENINIHGISYEDAKAIALDVFQNNFMQLSQEAAEIARERAEQITEKFLNELHTQNNEGVINAKDPDFQHALFSVQKDFARTGDEELGDLLVDLLVDRTKQENRSILQIVLNESLATAPKLIPEQLAALSVIFIFKNSIHHGINNLESLGNYLDVHISPFAELLTKNASCYQHLEFTGCGSISMGASSIGGILRQRYGGVFSKGFTPEELTNKEIDIAVESPIFAKCLHDEGKLQINAISEEVLRSEAQRHGIDQQNTNKLVGLNNSTLMNDNEIRDFLVGLRPYMKNVFDVWEGSFMKNMSLTSVGIAIGHANLKRHIGEFTDLSIWIN